MSQSDFVKSLIGRKYENAYEYFKKYIKPEVDPMISNAINEEIVDRKFHFENNDVKAFYIMWQFSKLIR